MITQTVTTDILAPPEVQAQALSLIEVARSLQITDQETLDRANGYLQTEALFRKKIEAHHAPMKATAAAAHRAACDAEKRALAENCGPIRDILTPKITAYLAEERRRAAEEQARRQAEAQRQAEDALLAQAAMLESQGVSAADVEAVLSAPVEVVAVPAPPPPAMQGVSERWEYTAQCLDPMALLRAVVAGQVPLAAIEVSQKYLNARARSDKELFSIPGCRLLKTPDLTVRTRR